MHTAVIAALVVVAQYAGIIGQIGAGIVGIDNAISASIGLHRTIAQNPSPPVTKKATR